MSVRNGSERPIGRRSRKQVTDMTTMQLRLSPAWLEQPATRTVARSLVGSIVLAAVGYTAVTVAFAASDFPGTLFDAQLSFDATTIREQYATLKAQGTFGTYVAAQVIDFVWIIGLMLTLFFAHVAIARGQRNHAGWRTLALRLAVIAPLIASADAFENLASFVMLARPETFPDSMAIISSSFAAIKWAWSIIGVTLLTIELVALAVNRRADRRTSH